MRACGRVLLALSLLLGAPAWASFLSEGEPSIEGKGLKPEDVRKVVHDNQATFIACYDAAVAKDDKLSDAGVVLALTIGPEGAVTKAGARSSAKPELAPCVEQAAAKLKFPAPGAVVRAEIPLEFYTSEYGYAPAGSGPGGGCGNGMGTIGTGRYGTIGHGGGAGTRPARLPSVSVGNPTVDGALDQNVVRRYLRRHLAEIVDCYAKQSVKKPQVEGVVTVRFAIDEAGSVRDAGATTTFADKEIAACVAAVVGRVQFPKPEHGTVKASVPFKFRKP